MANEPSLRWKLRTTPNPEEFGVTIDVDMTLIQLKMQDIPAPGILFNAFPWLPDKDLAADDQFGPYLYTIPEDIEGAWTRFWFAKNKTVEQANEPFRKTWKKHGNHRWPPLLKNVEIIEDRTFPRATNYFAMGQAGFANAPAYYDRYVYIPDVNEGTRFLLEEFYGPRPFIIPRYRTPIATAVQYSINGLQGGFQEALHDEITIPDTATATSVFLGGNNFAGSGMLAGQHFPRTNFKTWLPYVLYDEQEQRSGGWYRQRIRVFPPLRPRAIRRA